MIHRLKISPKYLNDILDGSKKFELRKDDRNFKVGDVLKLKEWKDDHFTRNYVKVKVYYKLSDCPQFGLMDGYCILGIGNVFESVTVFDKD